MAKCSNYALCYNQSIDVSLLGNLKVLLGIIEHLYTV